MTPEVSLTCAVVGVLCVLVPPVHRPLRHAVTALHEAGHAVVALLAGRRLQAVRLRPDSSGEAVSVGRSRGAGVVVTLLAGYPAPSAVGLLGLYAVDRERADLWAIGVGLVVASMGLLLRNAFAFVVVLVIVTVLLALVRWVSPESAAAVVAALSWFLLVASVRSCTELLTSREANDARTLASVSPLPAFAWKGLFLATSVAALVVAVRSSGLLPSA